MKSIVTLNERLYHGDFFARPFPITDCNYQASSHFDFQGEHCANSPAASFRNISSNYFHEEARYDFAIEAVLFATVVFISAIALAISAMTLIHFLRALGYF
jgi:hypothetical protein